MHTDTSDLSHTNLSNYIDEHPITGRAAIGAYALAFCAFIGYDILSEAIDSLSRKFGKNNLEKRISQ
jgi:hypothetical protein